MNILDLKISTLCKSIFLQHIDMATIPGSIGEFAILPDHIAMISTLNAGIVNIYKNNTIIETFYISSGFLKNGINECNILTNEFFNLKDIKIEQIEARLKTLNFIFEYNSDSVKDEIFILEHLKTKTKN